MRTRRNTLPPTRLIAVDVDGTLITRGIVNTGLVAWMRDRKADGFDLMLWSARGTAYAREAATRAGIGGILDVAIGKPGYIVDDLGWQWIKGTRVLTGADWERDIKGDDDFEVERNRLVCRVVALAIGDVGVWIRP